MLKDMYTSYHEQNKFEEKLPWLGYIPMKNSMAAVAFEGSGLPRFESPLCCFLSL